MPNDPSIILERYKIDANGCWVWSATCFQFGHGRVKIKSKDLKAHRVSWEYHKGPIPDGMFVLHTCDNPPCINPEHLFLGTQLENMRDMHSKNRNVSSLGEKHGRSKLTEVEVKQIKNMLLEGRYSHREIGEGFGVTGAAITQIAIGNNWRDVDADV